MIQEITGKSYAVSDISVCVCVCVCAFWIPTTLNLGITCLSLPVPFPVEPIKDSGFNQPEIIPLTSSAPHPISDSPVPKPRRRKESTAKTNNLYAPAHPVCTYVWLVTMAEMLWCYLHAIASYMWQWHLAMTTQNAACLPDMGSCSSWSYLVASRLKCIVVREWGGTTTRELPGNSGKPRYKRRGMLLWRRYRNQIQEASYIILKFRAHTRLIHVQCIFRTNTLTGAPPQ